MCRSIKRLYFADQEVTDLEIHDAARQFVRKISGFRKPSRKNEEVFELAVENVAMVTRKMLSKMI